MYVHTCTCFIQMTWPIPARVCVRKTNVFLPQTQSEKTKRVWKVYCKCKILPKLKSLPLIDPASPTLLMFLYKENLPPSNYIKVKKEYFLLFYIVLKISNYFCLGTLIFSPSLFSLFLFSLFLFSLSFINRREIKDKRFGTNRDESTH